MGSTRNLELVRSLGADHAIDYTRDGQRYDLIFTVAYRSLHDDLQALSPDGLYVSVGAPSLRRIYQDMLLGPRISKKGIRQVRGGWSAEPNRDLAFVKELIEAGKVKPVIDRIYPLDEQAAPTGTPTEERRST